MFPSHIVLLHENESYIEVRLLTWAGLGESVIGGRSWAASRFRVSMLPRVAVKVDP